MAPAFIQSPFFLPPQPVGFLKYKAHIFQGVCFHVISVFQEKVVAPTYWRVKTKSKFEIPKMISFNEVRPKYSPFSHKNSSVSPD